MLNKVGPQPPPPQPEADAPQGMTPGSVSVKFIQTQRAADEMFKSAKEFLLNKFDIVDDKNSDVKIIITSAISEEIDGYFDDEDQKKTVNEKKAALIFVQTAAENVPTNKLESLTGAAVIR